MFTTWVCFLDLNIFTVFRAEIWLKLFIKLNRIGILAWSLFLGTLGEAELSSSLWFITCCEQGLPSYAGLYTDLEVGAVLAPNNLQTGLNKLNGISWCTSSFWIPLFQYANFLFGKGELWVELECWACGVPAGAAGGRLVQRFLLSLLKRWNFLYRFRISNRQTVHSKKNLKVV